MYAAGGQSGNVGVKWSKGGRKVSAAPDILALIHVLYIRAQTHIYIALIHAYTLVYTQIHTYVQTLCPHILPATPMSPNSFLSSGSVEESLFQT